jgi:hypothetical protein
MGPPDMQTGDEICVFPNAKVPHVVRFTYATSRYGTGRTRVTGQLVGDVYVHGLMYGEVLSMGLEDKSIILE